MTARRRAAGVLAAGLVLLAVVWRVGPGGPPLYDGGPIVAEHYRYCVTPKGFTATKPPGQIDQVLKLENKQSPAMAETTEEQPSQAQLLAAQNSFVMPPGATAIHIVIKCDAVPSVPPLGTGINGNVYLFKVTAVPGETPVPIRSGVQVTVVLRGPAGVPGPLLEVFNGTAWTKLDTEPLGNTAPDSYASNITTLGDFALVLQASADSGGGGSAAPLIADVVVVVVVLGAAAAVLLLRRRGKGTGRRA